MSLMSRYNEHNMRGFDHLPGWCAICGRPHPEKHHIVPRSLGGTDGPLIHLCGFGNHLRGVDGELLHHGAVEQHLLWFWFADGADLDIAPDYPSWVSMAWVYLLTAEPVNEFTALSMRGWKPLG